ncbi:hypothetical protein D0469_05635 [Peribacillus saganii]|uniref:Uncharacterized protein n=1 Tax=Peribacillus saganii TaxID=2303992 RepID=A0A372LQY7_9BACI|nr:hypothetical protein [Peribacillus saganii]RFU70615.1 hypothetical protein D0469_05635 [Peribacillus saganii]
MYIRKFGNGSSRSAVEWVKANLKFIGNITSFEVYQYEDDMPIKYKKVPDIYVINDNREDTEKSYHLILRDDDAERETWLGGCNCGYGGTGPSATKEILQIAGIKMDYNVISEESIVKRYNLIPHHDLNIIVLKPLDRMHYRKEERLVVRLQFEEAHEKWETKKMLEVLGNFQPLRGESTSILEATYFAELPYSTEHEWHEYATNNGLVLSKPFQGLGNDTLTSIIENIGYKFNVRLDIKEL